MFANVLRLELRKQRQDFLVVVGIAAAVALCFLMEAIFRNRNLSEVWKDVFGFLSIGFVFVLALTGASSARHLRTEPYKSAEEALPFSPSQKSLGAYAVNVLYLLAGSTLFLIATYFFGVSKNLNWIQPALSILLIIHFHMLCFIFAYWLNHIVLSVALAALVVWCEWVLIEQRTFFFYFLQNPYVSEADAIPSFWSITSILASFVGGLISLSLISRRIERQRSVRWIPGLVASFILMAGSLLLFADLIRTSYTAQTKLWASNSFYWTKEYLNPSFAATQSSGAYLTTNTGSIIYVSPEHRTVLRNVPLHLLSKPNQFDVVAMYEEPHTREFWAIIRNDEADGKDYGIWRSSSGDKLQLHFEFNSKGVRPSYLVKCRDQFCVYGYTPEKIAYATISENALSEWQFFTYQKTELGFLAQIRNHLFKDEISSGKFASLSSDKTNVTRQLADGTVQKWSLPGKGDLPSFMASIIPPAFYRQGQPHFVVPVHNQSKTSLFVCNADGSVAQLWNKSWTIHQRLTWETIPGGGYGWVVREAQSWKPIEALVVAETGEPYPAFPIQTTSDYSNFVDFIKKENTSLWVLTGHHLSKIDLQTGKTLKQFDILADESDSSESIFRTRTKEGVYFVKDNRICLIDWDGKIRDLGPASLN